MTESSTAPQHWTTVSTRTVIFIVPFAEERNCGTVNERERERERERMQGGTHEGTTILVYCLKERDRKRIKERDRQ